MGEFVSSLEIFCYLLAAPEILRVGPRLQLILRRSIPQTDVCSIHTIGKIGKTIPA